MVMRKLRMGLVGGGEGAFIGAVHRTAAELDGQTKLVCGAFSSNPQRSRSSAQSIYGLPAERSYGSYVEMFAAESSISDSQKMDFVAIAVPNHVHYPVAEAALNAGFHVMSGSPVAFDLEQAKSLASLVDEKNLLFGLTYSYTGYPMIKEARYLVRSGAIGSVRRVIIEYIQGWLFDAQEKEKNKQAMWRTDPSQSGVAGCMGDLGIHGENLMEYVTGLQIESLCADLTTFVPGRKLEDDGNVLLRFSNGARGIFSASQIAVGVENGLRLRVYGELGSIEWEQMEPDSLVVRWPDRPYEIRRKGGTGVSDDAAAATRLPAGYPEGFLGAFALLYRNFADALRQRMAGKSSSSSDAHDFPTITDGIRGMEFVESIVESSNKGAVWVKFPDWD